MRVNQLHFGNREDWRKWLKVNHNKVKVLWLVFYKKHTGKANISYNDAVEEALCYGWIDSIIKEIDEDKYARKFTPRNDHSRWSELNKERAGNMIKQGKMTAVGLSKINAAKKNGQWNRAVSIPKTVELPNSLKSALQKNKKAWGNFKNLAPSYQRNFIMWVSSAKRQETKDKRLIEAIGLLERNERLGLK
ncbi:MAG: YdeI/OmpD-associated family protein [Dehalococcoidia bacterium]|nr:YdeI/OmpD-associated family protein [Dehalococcoidia bacterium]